jgi:Flp pilus assembly protein TadD
MPPALRLSLCMIVRDEAAHIRECLRSIRPLVSEMIVVDTGSTDGTDALARAEGAQVFSIAWPGSFADARNASLDRATGEWVLVLDADERIAPADFPRVRALIESGSDEAHQLIQRTYSDDSELIGWRPCAPDLPEARGFTGHFDSAIVRLLRRDPAIRFEGAIHELVEESMRRTGRPFRLVDIVIHHYKEEKTQREKRLKSRLYVELSQAKCRERPDDPQAAFELGMAHFEREEYADAAAAFARAAALAPDRAELWAARGVALLRAGRFGEAAEVYAAAVGAFPGHPDLLAGRGVALLQSDTDGRLLEQAERALADAVERDPNHFLAVLNRGVVCMDRGKLTEALRWFARAKEINPRDETPWMNMGLILHATGKYEEALAELRAAWERRPSRWGTALGLGVTLMELARFAEAEQWLLRARDLPGAKPTVVAQLASLRWRQGRHAEARRLAREAAERDPEYSSLVEQMR